MGLDEIFAVHLNWIHPKRACQQIDYSLNEIGGFGTSGPAIRIGGCGVGHHAVNCLIENGNFIVARHEIAKVEGRHSCPHSGLVRTEIGIGYHF